jgi:UDP-2-acetamido-2-deoxy-ribo-hexuluronate aminotransferase
MPVPFIDLGRFEEGFLEAWSERAQDVSRHTRFVGGPDVRHLEQRLSTLCGCPGVVGCANGTDALQLALRAVGVTQGDLVVIPDATFWATFEAVVNVGARVVTVDVSPNDLQMDFEVFRQAVETHRPRAAVLVHLYGWGSSHLDDYRRYCRQSGLPLVEDGAQAFGVEWRKEPIFQGAEVATVSFYPAKVLGACGDAGAVLCSDPGLAERVRLLGNHGRTSHYEHGIVGWNSRLGGLDAAYLDLSLDYLEARLESRRVAAAKYRQELGGLGVRAVAPPEGYRENGYLNVTLVDPEARPAMEAVLAEQGVGFGNVYPRAVSEQPGAKGYHVAHLGGGTAAWLGQSVLNLPLFAHIRNDEIAAVLDAMRLALQLAGGRPASPSASQGAATDSSSTGGA